ncbi:NUDIX domain protein [Bacillus clarus]|uniref:NUDIX domain protein n=1 Tax=Bacillus clarus TaxID=2338372 RepID=A0A090Z0I4_9BACI|nr:NUDIX domain protein [Bacillus clarus]
MKRPLLRAEAIIINEDHSKVLIHCDENESFYCFPGGSIELGESAREAIMRELMEEYDLKVHVQKLAIVNEHIFQIDGEEGHQCTLLHEACLEETSIKQIKHKEYKDIVLT